MGFVDPRFGWPVFPDARLRPADERDAIRPPGAAALLLVVLLLCSGCGGNVPSLNRKALLGIAAGDLAGAEQLLQEAMEKTPDEPILHANLAEVYCRLGRYEDARRHQALSAQLEPGPSPGYRRRLAEILLAAGRPKEAVVELEQLSRAEPDDAELASLLGIACLKAGEQSPAAALLEDCRARFPDHPFFPYAQAYLALEDRDPVAARALLEQVAAAHPDFPDAQLLLADLLVETGDFDAAVKRYETVLAFRNTPDLELRLGKALARLDRPAEAENHLLQAARGEFEGEALLELAILFVRNPGEHWTETESLSRAVDALDRILVADPLNLRARNLKGLVYARRRQLGPMLNEFTKSLSINPDQPEIRAIVDAYQRGTGG